MRILHMVFVSVALSEIVGCSASPKPESLIVTSSSLPEMQQYNGSIGKDYWMKASAVSLCEKPISAGCYQFLPLSAHVKVDGLVPHYADSSTGLSDGTPYFHVVLDDGRSGFVDARIWSIMTTTVDPAVAAAECKKRGDPKLGMNAKQVAATCWGPPQYVNTKVRATGKYEQYVYGDNKFVYLRDGIVTSISVKGRRPALELPRLR